LESAAYSVICEHLQKPHNAGSRHEAWFLNILLGFSGIRRAGPAFIIRPGLERE